MNPETISPGARRVELARAAGAALEAAAQALSRRRERHASVFGLSDAKLALLGVLACCPRERACLHALGDELGVTRPNVTKLVDGLERGGLVERLPHPHDRRKVHAHLTPEGRSVADDARPGREDCASELWGALDDDELAALVRLLRLVSGGGPPDTSTTC